MKAIEKKSTKNTILLYLLTAAKLLLPLVTLPYLTRVLAVTQADGSVSNEAYGLVVYVKSFMAYMQLAIDFGFMLSGVKDIVNANGDKSEIGKIAGQIVLARIFLAVCALVVSFALCFVVPLLREHVLFVMLYALSVALSSLLCEFLFRGIEKMHTVTIVYVTMKGVITLLTLILVKSANDLMLIPVLEIAGTLCAVIVSWIFIKCYGIPVKIGGIKASFKKLWESAIYFASNLATTVFSALNTVLIGIFIQDLNVVAFWGVSMQLIGAVQTMYAPINDGIYPQMIEHKDLKFIIKVLLIFMPIVLCGCLFCFFFADWILKIISGAEYVAAAPIFQRLIPILFFSFPGMLLGWPTLGAVKKEKWVTISTVSTAVFQLTGLAILAIFNLFNVYNLAYLRCVTELVLLIFRLVFVIINRKSFNAEGVDDKAVA